MYCPTDFLTVQMKLIYYKSWINKKLFCSCSFDKEDISPFNTCPKWSTCSEPTTTELLQTCPPPQICPECPKNIETVTKQACKQSEENDGLSRLLWMAVALLLVVIFIQALIVFMIATVVIRKYENRNEINLDNICPVQEAEDISVENDLYGRL